MLGPVAPLQEKVRWSSGHLNGWRESRWVYTIWGSTPVWWGVDPHPSVPSARGSEPPNSPRHPAVFARRGDVTSPSATARQSTQASLRRAVITGSANSSALPLLVSRRLTSQNLTLPSDASLGLGMWVAAPPPSRRYGSRTPLPPSPPRLGAGARFFEAVGWMWVSAPCGCGLWVARTRVIAPGGCGAPPAVGRGSPWVTVPHGRGSPFPMVLSHGSPWPWVGGTHGSESWFPMAMGATNPWPWVIAPHERGSWLLMAVGHFSPWRRVAGPMEAGQGST